MKIYTGQISYTLLYFFGIWKPLDWNSRFKIWLYHVYSTFMLTAFFTFTFSVSINLFRVPEDTDRFTENFFYVLSLCAILIKLICVMVKRNTAIEAKDMLLEKICQPRDFHESEILQKCSKACRSNMIIFLILVHISLSSIIFSPLAKNSKRTLPMSGWFPYSLESRSVFCLTYLYQILALMVAGCITVSVEGLALTIMLQICAQLEIIMHRLHLLPELQNKHDSKFLVRQIESKLIAKCVKHHVYMYSLGEKLNELFGFVIFFQFFASTLSLCVIIYQLSRLSLRNPTYWTMLSTAGSTITQIFLYCFYGDRITEKSTAVSDAVYQIHFITLTNTTKKTLIMMMIRATRPIKLTGLSLVKMSIETFVKILKSSYSAYNLLTSS